VTATAGFAFSCDSPDGCFAHAMVAGVDLAMARDTLCEVLGWRSGAGVNGDLCPDHHDQMPVPPVQ